MKVKTSAQRLHHAVAVLLCFLLSPVSALSFGDNNTSSFEPVGKITGLVSIATRNQTNSNIRDVVRANDSLSTNKSGRMRIELQDGSTLNVGFESDLKIVKHSPATGETTVDLVDGRLRSRVVRVRKSGSKFVVTTPNATISGDRNRLLLGRQPFSNTCDCVFRCSGSYGGPRRCPASREIRSGCSRRTERLGRWEWHQSYCNLRPMM